ncbi:leucine-rich repeat domain-containing protein [Micromonospora sp. NPDC047730]|uniref:leucine-rich repeat domain-containing protein n=1 Tax=unclassified Micromonospora TaxID=2617518 RepID=UPI0037153C52
MATPATYVFTSFDDADTRLGGALSAAFDGNYGGTLFFDGDLTLDGDFLDAVREMSAADREDAVELIVVTGDLTVTGRIALYDEHPGLYVAGRTEAETLEGGGSEISIHDGAFTHFVYGEHSEGTLQAGTVDTPWVIERDHPVVVTAPGARLVDNYGDSEDADFAGQAIVDAFVPEVVDADEQELMLDVFLDRLRAGLPVLRPGARIASERARDHVSGAVADRVEHLDLTGRDLRRFPAEVLRMPWLRTLVLDGNRIGELPEAIGKLIRLEHLSVCHCGLTALPDSIGDLAALRVLRLAGNKIGDGDALALPAAVGRLAGLEELDISAMSGGPVRSTPWRNVPGVAPLVLPDSFGGLVGLRRLVADGTNLVFPESAHGLTGIEEVSMAAGGGGYLKIFPDAVTTFPNLRRLDLSRNYFDAIPDRLLRLTGLEELDLGDSLGLVTVPLPDLGQLPALRVLGFSGRIGPHPAQPAHSVLRQLFGMTLGALKELRIDRWGPDKDRGELRAEHLAGIGAFRRLRVVDLSFNKLEDLPTEFDELPELAAVDLGYNRLPEAVRDRITAAHPAARFDFRS